MTTTILAVSTSSPRGSIAVIRGDRVLSSVTYEGGTAHAERLFAAIDAAMVEAGVTRADLGAIACDVGPGSFTGVRVGLAACQGIAVGLAVPVVGVGSLEAMAFAARGREGAHAVLAVLDARKDEVFAAIHDGEGVAVWGPRHLPRDEVAVLATARADHAPAALIVGGVLAEMPADVIALLGTPLRAPEVDLPDAVAIGRAAAIRLGRGPASAFDPALLEPVYVRAPDAKPMVDPPPDPPPDERPV